MAVTTPDIHLALSRSRVTLYGETHATHEGWAVGEGEGGEGPDARLFYGYTKPLPRPANRKRTTAWRARAPGYRKKDRSEGIGEKNKRSLVTAASRIHSAPEYVVVHYRAGGGGSDIAPRRLRKYLTGEKARQRARSLGFFSRDARYRILSHEVNAAREEGHL